MKPDICNQFTSLKTTRYRASDFAGHSAFSAMIVIFFFFFLNTNACHMIALVIPVHCMMLKKEKKKNSSKKKCDSLETVLQNKNREK